MTATVLVFLFCLLYTAAIIAQERSQQFGNGNGSSAKDAVSGLGFGKRVNVKLKSGETRSGRITGFAQDHFVVTDPKGTASAIAYAEVFRVSKQKEKLGIFDKPWQGIMFVAAGIGTVFVVTSSWLN